MTKLSRREFATGALASATLLTGCASSGFAPPSPQRRNLVLLILDDLNDWITALGDHPQVTAPHIKALAASGTVFTNAHAQAPICGPSRASLFSGLYPSQTGIYGQISDEVMARSVSAVSPTLLLPQYLRSHGFYTAGRGKVSHQGGLDGMFDEYLGWQKNYGPKPEKRFKWESDRTHTDWGAYPETDEDMQDHIAARWGVEFLGRDHTAPFLLALGFVRPHVPWYVPQKWLDMFPLEDIELPTVRERDMDDVPKAGRDLAAVPQMPTLEWAQRNAEWRPILQGYLASIAFADHCVGIVMKGLEESAYADNTMVCLLSDNGYHLGEKQRFAKMSLWGRSTRVPLMFSGPGIEHRVVTDPVGLIDVYPTVTDMLDLPSNPENAGRSLAPYLTGTGTLPLQPQVSVFGEGNYAVINQRYRYIRYADGAEELYDHQSDPMEWTNVAQAPEHAATKRSLARYIPSDARTDVMKASGG